MIIELNFYANVKVRGGPLAIKAQQILLFQVQKYSGAFDDVIYYMSSPELATHYNAIFQNAELNNGLFKGVIP